jgi:hypothetical protein
MTDKPVLSADASTSEGETKSLNLTSANNDPSAGPASPSTNTGIGAGTPLPPQPSAKPVASGPTPVDPAPVTSEDTSGSLANPQAAIPISSNTDKQELQPPPISEATSMDLDHPADRPSTGKPETS